jgi:hypothetical protein
VKLSQLGGPKGGMLHAGIVSVPGIEVTITSPALFPSGPAGAMLVS